MTNQESGARRGIFGISAPPQERTDTAVLPKPKTEPTLTPELGKPPNKKAFIARLAGALLALAGTAGPAVHHQINNETGINLPAVGRDVASVPGFYWNFGKGAVEDLQRLFSKEIPISPIFDAKADSSVIKVGINTVQITEEDLARIENNITPPPNPTEEHGLPALPQFTLLLPFLLKDGDQISMTKTYQGPGVEVTDEGKYTGKVLAPRYAGEVKFIVPAKGTEIISGIIDPKAVSIEVFKNPPFVTDKEYFGGVTIRVTRVDGSRYRISYLSPDDVRGLVPLDILNDAPLADNDYEKWLSQKGLSINNDTPIMKTGIANAPINTYISRISSSKPTKGLFFSTIQLFQSPDGKALYKPQSP